MSRITRLQRELGLDILGERVLGRPGEPRLGKVRPFSEIPKN